MVLGRFNINDKLQAHRSNRAWSPGVRVMCCGDLETHDHLFSTDESEDEIGD